MKLTKKRLLLLIAVLFLAAVLVIGSQFYSRKITTACTEASSRKIIKDLCQLYGERTVDGTICQELCVSQTLVFDSCIKLMKGNKHVMLANWNDDQVVLKTKYPHFHDYHRAPIGSGTPVDGPYILQRIYDQAKFVLGLDIERELSEVFRLMWTDQATQNIESMTRPQLHSLWSLLTQDEYIFHSYFQGQAHLPRILGSCGHVYAVEYTPSNALMGPFLFGRLESSRRSKASWQQRLELARGILDLVESFDNAFPQTLHMCDVKGDNFGVRPRDQVVTAIDVDIVFFEKRLHELLRQPPCKTNADCNFFDCHSQCNILTKSCKSQRSNNNLQAICEKIFLPDITQAGLLRNPPEEIKKDLKIALFHCMYASEPGTKASQTEAFQKLKSILATAKEL